MVRPAVAARISPPPPGMDAVEQGPRQACSPREPESMADSRAWAQIDNPRPDLGVRGPVPNARRPSRAKAGTSGALPLPARPGRPRQLAGRAFCAAIHASMWVSSACSGTEPVTSTASLKARRSNRSPSSREAFSRSSEIFSWPIL